MPGIGCILVLSAHACQALEDDGDGADSTPPTDSPRAGGIPSELRARAHAEKMTPPNVNCFCQTHVERERE